MALFVFIAVIIQNCFSCVTGFQIMQIGPSNTLEITPSTLTAGHYIGLYEAGDNLNLSCTFTKKFFMSHDLDWNFPRTFNRSNSFVNKVSSNLVNLIVDNLTENDSGEYKCTANVKNLVKFEKPIQINVKTRKGGCSETMFQCSYGICIPKRFMCDGFRDCHYGEDELLENCGSWNPCENKLRCPDGRCIPYAWCCDPERDRNCTIKEKHSCCIHMEKLTRDIDSDLGYPYEHDKFNDFGFVGNLLYRLNPNSTTIYTVIGCAFSFLFIVSVIIVIKTCRTQSGRSVRSRCPAASRNVSIPRSSTLSGTNLNYFPFYDFNRSACSGNDFLPLDPLVVSYNVNNGIQFIGRPIDPPPYCEILTSPPREGPPPPYASQECLFPKQMDEITQETDDLDAGIGSDESESNNLLNSQNGICVISCNAMDGMESVGECGETGHPTEPDDTTAN